MADLRRLRRAHGSGSLRLCLQFAACGLVVGTLGPVLRVTFTLELLVGTSVWEYLHLWIFPNRIFHSGLYTSILVYSGNVRLVMFRRNFPFGTSRSEFSCGSCLGFVVKEFIIGELRLKIALVALRSSTSVR